MTDLDLRSGRRAHGRPQFAPSPTSSSPHRHPAPTTRSATSSNTWVVWRGVHRGGDEGHRGGTRRPVGRRGAARRRLAHADPARSRRTRCRVARPGCVDGHDQAGGVDLPGEIAGLVALDELVLHGWDVAHATGQPTTSTRPALEAVHGFVEGFSAPDADRGGLFGPVVPVPDDAPLLDRTVGLAGRDPHWSPR